MESAIPYLPRLLLIGATARDAGKTQLACKIIGRMAAQVEVVAVKVTVADAQVGACARGGPGCGVCATLGDGFSIYAEDHAENGGQVPKDTAKMKAAGETRSFWLRASRNQLVPAFESLLDRIGPRPAIVCESTSLRAYWVPGVFLLATRVQCPPKPSAAALAEHADRTVIFDGRSGDFDVADLSFDCDKQRWRLKQDATAIIMAGGRSTRMGRNKALIRVADQTLIERICGEIRPYFREVLISGNLPNGDSLPGTRSIPDRLPNRGPLMGLASTLVRSSHDRNFVRACDIPDMQPDLVARMLREARFADLVVPRSDPDRAEPLFAVYRKSTLPAIEAALETGDGRISAIFNSCKVRWLALDPRHMPENLNTPSDVAAYRRRLSMQTADPAEDAPTIPKRFLP